MAKVILGIHGLGNKVDKGTLTAWWRQSMLEGLALQGINCELPHFEIVYWADIVYPSPLDCNIKDADHQLFVDEKYQPAPADFTPVNHSFQKRVIKYLGKQLYRIFLNEDLTLNYSFIPDYFIRKYFKEVDLYFNHGRIGGNPNSEEAREAINRKLMEALELHKDDEVMLISHSMGSIIAYDVLTFVMPSARVNTFVTMGSPLGSPLIVSKIATQYKLFARGRKEMVTPQGVYGSWINLLDVLDRVSFNFQLSKKFKKNALGISSKDIHVINDYHNSQGEHNPHKSYGYLRTKQFAETLCGFILQ